MRRTRSGAFWSISIVPLSPSVSSEIVPLDTRDVVARTGASPPSAATYFERTDSVVGVCSATSPRRATATRKAVILVSLSATRHRDAEAALRSQRDELDGLDLLIGDEGEPVALGEGRQDQARLHH